MMALCVVVDFCEEICLSGDVDPLRFSGRVNGDGDDAQGFAVFGVEFGAEVLRGGGFGDRLILFDFVCDDLVEEVRTVKDAVFEVFPEVWSEFGKIGEFCHAGPVFIGVDGDEICFRSF